MPSRSSSRRSERSSCFVVVSSRNAANISVEPAIHSPHGGRSARPYSVGRNLPPLPTAFPKHLDVRYQCRFMYCIQRECYLETVFPAQHHMLVIRDRQDLHALTA